MNAQRLLCIAALPIALALSGCESAPVKDMQKMLGSMLPSDKSEAPKPAPKTYPPQTIAAQVEPTEQRSASSSAATSRGFADLQAGVSKYEDGAYADASTRLHSALAAGLTSAEAVRAHKYLAFIHCTSKRERLCRAEFRKALALDPSFQLNAAEAGHPMWGPVFRDVKQRG